MFNRHFKVWPRGVPLHLVLPETTLPYNLEVSARRYPDHSAIAYYGKELSYAALWSQVQRLAGFLQRDLGVGPGDRVLLYMQNSPQFIIGYYAILRADAVVVPVNPMFRAAELEHLVADTGARVALIAQELIGVVRACHGTALRCVVACYADYADPQFDLSVPDLVRQARDCDTVSNEMVGWQRALATDRRPRVSTAQPDDLAVLPYSSGSTGRPKGCMHTHRSVMTTLIGGLDWNPVSPASNHLASLPLFHVTGMQACMNQPLFVGGRIVIMTRWDRRVAAALIERYRVNRWRCITTMAMDFVNEPGIDAFDLSSLDGIGGGGAAMSEAVARRLHQLTGLHYIEGYGLSETIAATHINPVDRPKERCLGIPVFDVDSRVISLDTGRELPPGEVGEIILDGPQVFKGYWNDPQATARAFVEHEGKRFFRTGDLGYYDEEGYFFMVDRLKRMINVAGFKVWPAELEVMLLQHPALAEVCVIGMADARRGESVKACVVLRERPAERPTEEDLIRWCRSQMAAYKCPSRVEFMPALPRTATGKIAWRELQDREQAAAAAAV